MKFDGDYAVRSSFEVSPTSLNMPLTISCAWYEVSLLPKASVPERVDFVLSTLAGKSPCWAARVNGVRLGRWRGCQLGGPIGRPG